MIWRFSFLSRNATYFQAAPAELETLRVIERLEQETNRNLEAAEAILTEGQDSESVIRAETFSFCVEKRINERSYF